MPLRRNKSITKSVSGHVRAGAKDAPCAVKVNGVILLRKLLEVHGVDPLDFELAVAEERGVLERFDQRHVRVGQRRVLAHDRDYDLVHRPLVAK